MATIVNSRATSVIGLIAGRNRPSYQFAPRALIRRAADQEAGKKRNAEIGQHALAMVPNSMSTTCASSPTSGGSTVR
jgi:hypothetical protein